MRVKAGELVLRRLRGGRTKLEATREDVTSAFVSCSLRVKEEVRKKKTNIKADLPCPFYISQRFCRRRRFIERPCHCNVAGEYFH